MYARLALTRLAPGSRARWDAVRPQILALIREQPGFVSSTPLYDAATNEGGLLGVWETAEASHAAGVALQPKVRELLGDIAQGPPTIRVFDVPE